MIDFQLTETGDLALEESNVYDRCTVSFYIAEYPIQRIEIITPPKEQNIEPMYHQQKIRFYTVASPRDMLQGNIAEDMAEKIQAVRLKLATELGDIPYNRDYGSTLWQSRHMIITDDEYRDNFKKIVNSIVYDIIPEASVEILYTQGSGYFSFATLTINLYDQDELLTSFIF